MFFAAITGAALFTAMLPITPAISVLSAVEGLKLVEPAFGNFVLPLAIFILFMLFWVRKKEPARFQLSSAL